MNDKNEYKKNEIKSRLQKKKAILYENDLLKQLTES